MQAILNQSRVAFKGGLAFLLEKKGKRNEEIINRHRRVFFIGNI